MHDVNTLNWFFLFAHRNVQSSFIRINFIWPILSYLALPCFLTFGTSYPFSLRMYQGQFSQQGQRRVLQLVFCIKDDFFIFRFSAKRARRCTASKECSRPSESFLKLIPYTPAGFELTTHNSRGRR
jgi:hypothetical protein